MNLSVSQMCLLGARSERSPTVLHTQGCHSQLSPLHEKVALASSGAWLGATVITCHPQLGPHGHHRLDSLGLSCPPAAAIWGPCRAKHGSQSSHSSPMHCGNRGCNLNCHLSREGQPGLPGPTARVTGLFSLSRQRDSRGQAGQGHHQLPQGTATGQVAGQ